MLRVQFLKHTEMGMLAMCKSEQSSLITPFRPPVCPWQ